jgi:hypothetical protein
MLTLMALDNLTMAGQRLRYRACDNRTRHFAHLPEFGAEHAQVQEYVQTSLRRFCNSHTHPPISTNFVKMSKEIYDRGWEPLPCRSDETYQLDHFLDSGLASRLGEARDVLRRTFLAGLRIPDRFAEEAASGSSRVRHAVIHVRMGDASMRGLNPEARQLLDGLMAGLWQRARREDALLRIWLHTDDQNDPDLRTVAARGNVHICNGTLCGDSVVHALRDMAYADWLVIADSSFSRFAAWINERAELIVAPRTTCATRHALDDSPCMPGDTKSMDAIVRSHQAEPKGP